MKEVSITELEEFFDSRPEIGQGVRETVMDKAWRAIDKERILVSRFEEFKEYLPAEFFKEN